MTNIQPSTWSIHEVFVQANLVDGFEYLDRSGVVLNRIRRDFRTLNVVDPNGTVLSEPREANGPYALRFGSERIWLHYAPVDSPEHIVATAPGLIRGIA